MEVSVKEHHYVVPYLFHMCYTSVMLGYVPQHQMKEHIVSGHSMINRLSTQHPLPTLQLLGLGNSDDQFLCMHAKVCS